MVVGRGFPETMMEIPGYLSSNHGVQGRDQGLWRWWYENSPWSETCVDWVLYSWCHVYFGILIHTIPLVGCACWVASNQTHGGQLTLLLSWWYPSDIPSWGGYQHVWKNYKKRLVITTMVFFSKNLEFKIEHKQSYHCISLLIIPPFFMAPEFHPMFVTTGNSDGLPIGHVVVLRKLGYP